VSGAGGNRRGVRALLAAARDRALGFPVRRPGATLVVAALLSLLAVFGVTRLRPDTSLESMFAKGDPAADAMVRVLNTFSAVEELLVLVSVPDAGPSAAPGPQPAKLVAFAERFERALAPATGGDPSARPLADRIMYRADPDARRFFEEVLIPAGMFYLDDDALAAARARLAPEGMRRQLARNESLLAQPGPAAAAAAELLTKDPLRLNEFIKARFASLASGSHRAMSVNGNGTGGAMLSPDKRALLIRVVGRRPPSDLDFAKSLVAAATGAAAAANADGLDVSFGGAYAIATTSERAIRADATWSSAGALACIVVLFVLVYRRPVRLLLLAIGPLALGSLLGFGAHVLVEPTLTILSAAVGAMMLGMGIDHSVHYLTHYESRRAAGLAPALAAGETSRHLVPAMFAAWLTSVIGFVAIGQSDVRALGDFALLGSLGLAGVFLTSITVLPALLVLSDGRTLRRQKAAGASNGHAVHPEHAGGGGGGDRARLRFSVKPLLDRIARHRRLSITCSLSLFVAALAVALLMPGPIIPLESDLTVMHPRPNPALETQAAVVRRFDSAPSSLAVLLKADTPDALVALAHQVDERFRRPEVRSAGVAGTIGLSTFLPDPATAARRLEQVSPGEAERVVADFRAAVADSAFEPAAFRDYENFLRSLLSRREPPALADLLRYPGLARAVLPSSAFATPSRAASAPTEAITLILLDRPVDQRDDRASIVKAGRAALDGLGGGVTLTGLPVLGHDAEQHVRTEIPRVFAVSLGLVLLYVLVHFRSARDALLSMSMVAFSLVILLAITRLTGLRLNMINLTALPLLIGMTLDYGIFLVSLSRDAKRHGATREAVIADVATSAQAVLVCAASTVLGFGSLAFNSVPAVQSLGIVVAAGMIASLGGTLFLLAPLLLGPRKSPPPQGVANADPADGERASSRGLAQVPE
jgi:predicted RND superfamily exporter protein